jgi:hypothetical protein
MTLTSEQLVVRDKIIERAEQDNYSLIYDLFAHAIDLEIRVKELEQERDELEKNQQKTRDRWLAACTRVEQRAEKAEARGKELEEALTVALEYVETESIQTHDRLYDVLKGTQ